jgi:putative FmdB family regulatory protein
MPIYAYKCATCGHADDVMQKMSDPARTTCPKCGAETYAKQLTAPGFALKGSGWYVTDFRDGKKPESAKLGVDNTKADAAKTDASKTDAKPAATEAAPSSTPTPAATSTPAASPTPAATT